MIKTPFISKNQVEDIIKDYPTPFYLYSEEIIRKNAQDLNKAFSWNEGFCEYFAVKATPTPGILKILSEEGCGYDCATKTELKLVSQTDKNAPIMFSSNATPDEDFLEALEIIKSGRNLIINLDDITHIDILSELCKKNNYEFPDKMLVRYNPGYSPLDAKASGNTGKNVIGEPAQSKYGLTDKQIFTAYKKLSDLGVKQLGIHSFLASNTLNHNYYPALSEMLFGLINKIKEETGISTSFINLSGGIGVPYRDNEEPADIFKIGQTIMENYKAAELSNVKIFTELGRFMLAPAGALVTKAIREKHTHKEYIGVDACAANLMRPAIYGAYHFISVLGKENAPKDFTYDITGGLCENCDKFAIDRKLPKIEAGDILVIHDCGAHGHSMGYNYNGKLRSAEILFSKEKGIKLLRRAETIDDYFRTMVFDD